MRRATLDRDETVQEDAAEVARALTKKMRQLRRGDMQPEAKLQSQRTK